MASFQRVRHESTSEPQARRAWWRAEFSPEQQRWWRSHAQRLPAPPSSSDEQLLVDPKSHGSFAWRQTKSRDWAPCVRIKLTDHGEYDPAVEYVSSRKKRDPLISAHGRVSSMGHRNHLHAIEFLSDFGPLLPDAHGECTFWLNLDDFWSMHARFSLVTDLWSRRDDIVNLRAAWRKLHEGREEALAAFADTPEAGFAPLYVDWDLVGIAPTVGSSTPPREAFTGLPWRMDDTTFHSWIRTARADVLRLITVAFVNRELNLRMQDRRPYWRQHDERGVTSFRLEIAEGSLWSSIWEFFGRDTSQGLGWKICPHCEEIFYPNRSNQVFCDPRRAGRFKKREWARRYRAGKRSKKTGGS